MAPFEPVPAPAIEDLIAYEVPRPSTPVDLFLDGNEGRTPPAGLLRRALDVDAEKLRRYPSARGLEARLAERHGVAPERVVVTAGADEALDRVCRALLAPGRQAILPAPTFVMIPHYVRLAGGETVGVPWPDGPYPAEAVEHAVRPETALVFFVSPNNPTGAVGGADELRRVARAAPHALVVLDHAYAEFADEDLTPVALELENACVLRTFSKALGLAGLRVGYAIAPPRVADWMRAAGGPYSVSSLSIALVEAALEDDPAALEGYVTEVRRERARLATVIDELGGEAVPSQANFVCARFSDEHWVQDALAGLGIGVRRFPGVPGLEGRLRITCPGRPDQTERLEHALRTALSPEAVLLAAPRRPEPAWLGRLERRTRVQRIGADEPTQAHAVPKALRTLGVERAWLVGDEPGTIRAAREAHVVPLGLHEVDGADPGALVAAGAARVLDTPEELEALLP